MKDLDKEARNEIIQEMSLYSLNQNTYIYKQGGIGNYFYILKEGIIEIIQKNINKKREINIGKSLDELALLHEAKRLESARPITKCYLWVIEEKILGK